MDGIGKSRGNLFSWLNSSFLKDGLALMTGSAWAQLIAFVAYIVLARLFTPEEIGIYNIFYSYVDIFIIVSTGKYELAVVIATDDDEARALSRLSLRLNALISCLLIAVVVVLHIAFPRSGVALVDSNFYTALLIPPMVFFCGTSRVYTSLLNRMRRFKAMGVSEMIGSTTGVVSKILMGLPRWVGSTLHSVALPIGTVIGKICGNMCLRLSVPKNILDVKPQRGAVRNAAAKYRNFPLYTMPKDFVSSISHNLPFIWIAAYFDKAYVGLFAMALTFTFRPVNILNGVFEKLLYVRLAERKKNGVAVMPLIKRFILCVSAIALPFFVIGFVLADPILGFLFGGKWTGCGVYVRMLLPWIYVMLTSSSLVCVANVFSRQRAEFVFSLALLAMRVCALAIGLSSGSFQTAIGLFSVAGMVACLSLTVWYLHVVRSYDKGVSAG